ncbi:chlorophyll a-b binding protein [Chloropicon roscoffensis]|uniref:Chlorophyll a-b binding protein, chloroplastic n=1 Tax=Chloropicon roscoffensis TaxID=1461544 RepID=A0AAX4PI07_9CHLO|mmetsp:Transcript_5972/g.18037  ORF Transcript_5972/g.18037 Transcript_5972/m.18037 type:complete len:320 (-) Transcript_5972:98-1057(-)|eukprot:CAMPEP_0198461806 /NCGR_PEP_ID=MMETSP1456-20131121/460_1 /TAXON_ID=1461544 ORGANISM="Unidentified sp., Strain RCC1871" /NCGR_SAMPLE_ID=MMETSP1456 /ASSEMBLY_ACC=CAM_ASM_001119 /LENGTH=319 /DNA_ID=CAMNT_0044186891 /DNA_START=96 /DNA_END=1055 /DNA_ORIENTATION=-
MQRLTITSNKGLGVARLPAQQSAASRRCARPAPLRAAETEEGVVKAEETKAPAVYVEPEDTRWGFKPPRPDAIVQAEQQGLRKVNGVKKSGIWFGSEQSLSYLDGSLAGDYGFDPLGVYDPEGEGGVVNQAWLRHAEIMHGRWAMLGAAGCIAPEFLGKVGVIPESTGLIWYKAGVIGPLSEGFQYWTDPYTIFFGQIVLLQFAELRRLQDFKKPGSMKEQYFLGLEGALGGSGDPNYPGGPIFNFMDFGGAKCMFRACRTEESLDEMKIREIKHGRMAMLAMFGYGAQAVLCGGGPYQNLLDHISDPSHINMAGNLIS